MGKNLAHFSGWHVTAGDDGLRMQGLCDLRHKMVWPPSASLYLHFAPRCYESYRGTELLSQLYRRDSKSTISIRGRRNYCVAREKWRLHQAAFVLKTCGKYLEVNGNIMETMEHSVVLNVRLHWGDMSYTVSSPRRSP